jgi:hypothetical protein
MDRSFKFYLGLYPVLIFQTRYGGIYEKGSWASIAKCESVPDGAVDSDIECVEWWMSDESKYVGIGFSPNEAYLDMLNRYREDGLLDE